MSKKKWKVFGIFYFTFVFLSVPSLGFAYIDPSVTTYAIQAIAGVAVAAGAFFATYGRRMKKSWLKTLDIDENDEKIQEEPLELSREDLRVELENVRYKTSNGEKIDNKKKKGRKGILISSIIIGLGFSAVVSLRPILSFYLSNEWEFWFKLNDIIRYIVLLFAVLALAIGIIHFFLPGKGKVSIRLLFAVIVCAGSVCVFVQNHFMTSYLPVLTGEPIDWSRYTGWGIASLVLWIGVFVIMIIGVFISPRGMKVITYTLMLMLFITEVITGGVDLLTTKHEENTDSIYFSRTGIFETSKKGNVIVLISDTFEGTYMNEILKEYPEVQDLLPEITYYDNMTGIGSMTYLSYPVFLSGKEFPMGYKERSGIANTFQNEVIVSAIHNNGWDISYYSDFIPESNLKGLIQNIADGRPIPTEEGARKIVLQLWKNTLFQSVPQQLKNRFVVNPSLYDVYKATMSKVKDIPYTEDDTWFYNTLKENGISAIDGNKPKYSLIQLWGLHDPTTINEDFIQVDYEDSISLHERKLKAGRAMLKMIRELLDQLKEQGAYDNTTIIMTADHGFNMRYYPVMLVKEAGRIPDGFRVDSTPLSLIEDFVPLITQITKGKPFSQAVNELNISPNRERFAIDYRSLEGYAETTDRRTPVTISGEAKDPTSYVYGNDEYLLNNDFKGRYQVNEPFIVDGDVKESVAVYGLTKGRAHGHTIVFDAFSDTEETRTLTLKIRMRNITKDNQKIICRENDNIIQTFLLDPENEEEIAICLPPIKTKRRTVYMDLPDAQIRVEVEKVLPWVAFNSIDIINATFVEE